MTLLSGYFLPTEREPPADADLFRREIGEVAAAARDALAGSPEELAGAIPGARAVTLPGCDHFSAIPHALFKASVFDFLDGTMDL